MGLSQNQEDEAFSEGLVALTEAAQTYDPSRNVPVAAWLARNIRWSIKSWRLRQTYSQVIPIETQAKDDMVSNAEFHEFLGQIQNLLNPRDQLILLATMLGYNGKEIGEFIGQDTMFVSRAKRRIRERLKTIRPDL
jgi:RNA polymerase sigma factor (sigma-70 family)